MDVSNMFLARELLESMRQKQRPTNTPWPTANPTKVVLKQQRLSNQMTQFLIYGFRQCVSISNHVAN